MRTRLSAVIVAVAIALSATAASAAERYDPDDALGTDSIQIDVVCATDDLPAGVDAVVEVDGQDVYRAPAPFVMSDHGGFRDGTLSRTDEADVAFDATDSMVVDGNAYFPYPSAHATVSVLFAFVDGTTWTATATYDANGCIDTFGWADSDALQVTVNFRAPDGSSNLSGPVDAQVGEAVDLSVVTANIGPDASLADGWLLGLEVGAFIDQAALVLERCNAAYDACATVDAADIEVIPSDSGPGSIIQIEVVPNNGDVLDPGDQDVQYLRATFAETGQFTGTVFLFGEAA